MADSERYEHRRRDSALVERCRAGDERAFGELYDAWFDRVHDLAGRILRSPDLAAEVAQDTFLTVWRRLDTLEDPDSFGGWLLRIARNRALNVVERERRSTAVDDRTMAGLESGGAPVSAAGGVAVEQRLSRAEDPTAAAEDAEVVALVWSAADALGERDRTVLDLTLRHGLTPAEVGEVVGVNRNAANQLVHRVKGRLGDAVGARVLWDGPAPRCAALAAELSAAGIDRFGPEAAQVATGHADSCDSCAERRRLRLQPAALFSAIPMAVAPVLVKQQAAAALEAAGVPMSGSAFGGGSPGSGPSGGSPGTTSGSTQGGSPGPDEQSVLLEGPITEDAVGPRPRRRLRLAGRILVGLLVVTAVLGLALVFGADETGEVTTADAPAGTTTTAPGSSSTTTSTTTEPPTTEPPTTVDGGPVVPPPPVLSPTTQPTPVPTSTTLPPEATVSVLVRPSQHPRPYVMGTSSPVLEWAVTVRGIDPSAVEVTVTGPGLSAVGVDGSRAICPVPAPQSYCDAEAGAYEYFVTVTGPGGSVLAQRSAVLLLVG